MIDELLRRRPSMSSNQLSRRDGLAIAAAALIAVVIVTLLPKEPDHQPALTVRNPTPYELHLAVTHADGSTTPLGYAEPDGNSVLMDVIVPTGTWTLTITSEGHPGADLDIDSDRLAATGWTVDVPDGVGDALDAQGVHPRS